MRIAICVASTTAVERSLFHRRLAAISDAAADEPVERAIPV
jgi:hypothetical protein